MTRLLRTFAVILAEILAVPGLILVALGWLLLWPGERLGGTRGSP